MKVAQIGLGSMGKRRLRCLAAHNVTSLVGFDPSSERGEQVTNLFGIPTTGELADVWKWDPAALIVSVPGRYQTEYLPAGARAGKHIFVEVPLSLSRKGVEELRTIACA